MLRVVSVVDKIGTALHRLSTGVEKYHNNLDYQVVDVHPKRPSPEQIARFELLARTADIMDYQYYRTAEMLRARYDWLKDIPSVLSHNNPYSIKESDWNSYQAVTGNNKSIFDDLSKITLSRLEHIQLAVDPNFWKFNDEYTYEQSVIMVANRIESKKGILPVAQACKELGIKMYLVGAISDPNYWQEVINTGVVHYAQEITDEDLRTLYHTAGVHVCNSVDNFESGTLPVLEAIFCGVPVISRLVGHVPEFKEHVVVNHHQPEDASHLAKLIHDTLADKKKLMDMREEAWFAIKEHNFERRAYKYQKLYRELLDGQPVTVIVPIAGKEEITRKCLNAIANQTHSNLEIIVVDDGDEDQKATIDDFGETVSIPVRYIRLGGEGYNLAKARNLAAIEATSDILVFCDQRQVMNMDCVEKFVENLKPKHWLYGNKGARKDWVENLSCVSKADFFTLGPFDERIEQYGGLTQSMRARARRNGFNLEYIESAKAEPAGKSSNRRRKKLEILQSKNQLWKMGLL